MKICFLTKKEKKGVKEAIEVINNMSNKVDIYYGNSSNSFPDVIAKESYDLLISYMSPWIVPQRILLKTKKWNINFHPGPPEYPGIGCFNFAIFNSAKEYGATAHIMEKEVDSGLIIGVQRFSMTEKETVKTLSIKTYNAQLILFKYIINFILLNDTLPKSDEKWKKNPYKRSDLEALATIDINMSQKEIINRIRATYYAGKPAPFIDIYGHRFEYNPDR